MKWRRSSSIFVSKANTNRQIQLDPPSAKALFPVDIPVASGRYIDYVIRVTKFDRLELSQAILLFHSCH